MPFMPHLIYRLQCQRSLMFSKNIFSIINPSVMFQTKNKVNFSIKKNTNSFCLLGINSDSYINSLYGIQKRFYAKGKNKGKGGKSIQSHITTEELSEVINTETFKQELDETLEKLKEAYAENLSIRSSIGSLESLLVELDGDTYPLSEIAQVIRKSPTMVVINATAFPQASPNIKKTILESGMNLNPQQDGTTFFIPIPKITKEHREKLAQNAKSMCDKTKTELKEIQNKYVKKSRSKEGKVSEDLVFNAQVKMREMTQQFSTEAETLMKNKQKELLNISK